MPLWKSVAVCLFDEKFSAVLDFSWSTFVCVYSQALHKPWEELSVTSLWCVRRKFKPGHILEFKNIPFTNHNIGRICYLAGGWKPFKVNTQQWHCIFKGFLNKQERLYFTSLQNSVSLVVYNLEILPIWARLT